MRAAGAQGRGSWPIRRLFDLCYFIPGKAHEPFIDPLGDYICVNSKFISTEGQVAKACNKNVTPSRTGDILMVMSDLPNGRALAKCFLVDEDDKYAVNQRVCILRAKVGNDPQLLFHILNRNPYFLSFDDGVNQTHLLNPTFQKCEVAVPDDLHEQQAIAAALSDADGVVAGLERVIAKKRLIKQGAMQDLLTARRRLPGFSGEWEVKRLGDALTVRHGRSQKEVEHPTGEYPILATGGQIGTATKFLCDKPSVLIGRKGTIDVPRFMDTPFWSVDTLFYTDVHSGYDARFLFYVFLIVDWMSYNEASGVPSLNAKTIENIEVQLPKIEEQKAISHVLRDMDSEIQTLEARLTKARAIKEGMMQNLLTGRVRLV